LSFYTGTLLAWLGHSCFVVTTLSGANLLIDPVSPQTGYVVAPHSINASVTFLSSSDPESSDLDLAQSTDNVVKPEKNPGYEDGSFRYVAQGKQQKVQFLRIFSYRDDDNGKRNGTNTITKLNVDGLRICDLGDLGQSSLTAKQVQLIGPVDILLIPVGGGDVLNARQAASITAQLHPKLIFPMHFRGTRDAPALKAQLEPVDNFVAAMKGKAATATGDFDRYAISPDRLPAMPTIVLLTEPS
jgi:L-ascorbate metabolism protein UlaG (beta-lactamase superfamily)